MSDRLKKLFKPETLVPVLILLALLNILFFPVIWGNKTLIHSAGDASSIMPYGAYEQNKEVRQSRRSNDDGAPAWFSEPSYALLHNQYFKLMIPPLWNPYNGFGAPLLANMQSQPFNPLVLIACLAPSPRTDDLFVLARLLLAGVLTNLYLRRLIGAYGSIFGAISFMLTGYMIMFLNMPEISVSMWMPGLFLGLELLAESISFNRVILSGFFTAMILLGGMPEVAFLELFIGGIYLLIRVLTLKTGWKTRNRFFLAYALSCIIGLGLAAPQILPFLEYIRESFNSHAGTIGSGEASGPGSVFQQNFPAHFLNYLAPLIYGPLGEAKVRPGFGYDGFNGYWGVLCFAFAMVAVSFALDRNAGKSAAAKPIILFFAGAATILLCKKFGVPFINLLGALPLFKLVVFWKYSEPILGFAMATLAAIGFDLLSTGRLQKRTLLIGFSTATAILLATALYDKRFLWGDHVVHMVFNKILSISIALLCIACGISLLSTAKPLLRPKLCRFLLILLCTDLSTCFLLPMFYWFHQLADQQANPYKGAPYVTWLKSNLNDSERVLGFDGVLFPNWSSAFQLRDIRNLDAMYPARYLNFIRNFLTEHEPTELADFNLTNRFNGTEKLADPLFASADQFKLDRLWYLSSIRYLLATRDHFQGKPTEIIQSIVDRSKAEPQFLRLDAFTIDNQTKHVLFQHPRGSRALDSVDYQCIVDRTKPFLNFSIAIDPQVRDIADSDGMTFAVHVIASAKDINVFSRNIEPKRKDADRHWLSESVDLSKFAGQSIKLVFEVTPGPGTNTSGDWGGWADIQLSNSTLAPSKPTADNTAEAAPQLVYDKEVKIFKTATALPRASMFYQALIAKDDSETLTKLRSKDFNIHSTVLLSPDQIEPAMLPPVITNEELRSQKIILDTPLTVKVAVDSKHDGILMLNNQFYPGWTVYVDGKPDELLRADYLFDAVLVKEGQHEVLFQYEPLSFYGGACLWALTLFSISAYAFFIGRRKTSANDHSA
ncbi:MAG: hypothetical protein EKK48_23020 [Candidatus Melainabacteria bacterium]|nr:MAG: hypothetical protein EKK48_23020 [Candidatus Melainabacteria bacterium]